MRRFVVLIAFIAALGVMTLPAAAQNRTDTITVMGMGSASGTPDVANMIIGVRTIDPDVGTAFSRNNQTVQAVIDAVTSQGVAREDISTFNIYAYVNNNQGFPPPDPSAPPSPTYEVTNDLSITVRDTSTVGEVISAAVAAGANNINSLNFSFSNQDELESQARAEAIAEARAQAEEYAALVDVQLGEVVAISETPSGFGPVPFAAMGGGGGGGGPAPIEPGQLSVNVQVEVTYAIQR